MFKSILTWIVRIGFGGELGEEKDSVYHKKRLCLPLSSTLRERECRGLVGKLPAVNGLRLWPTGLNLHHSWWQHSFSAVCKLRQVLGAEDWLSQKTDQARVGAGRQASGEWKAVNMVSMPLSLADPWATHTYRWGSVGFFIRLLTWGVQLFFLICQRSILFSQVFTGQ